MLEETQEDSDAGGKLFVTATGLKADTKEEDWIVDSGASRHMTFQKNLLWSYRVFETPKTVLLRDGRTVNALGVRWCHNFSVVEQLLDG